MTIASRLRRLERDLGTRVCQLCGGKGKLVVTHLADHEPVPTVEGCPSCGEVLHLLVTYRDESLPGRPRVTSDRKMTGAEIAALYD